MGSKNNAFESIGYGLKSVVNEAILLVNCRWYIAQRPPTESTSADCSQCIVKDIICFKVSDRKKILHCLNGQTEAEESRSDHSELPPG